MDNIIEKRVEFGKAQWLPFIFLFIVDVNDGCQIILSSFLSPIVKEQWGLSSHQVSIITSLFFLGTFVGSIVSGYLSDRKGRRYALRIGCTMQLVSACLFFLANNFISLNIIRFIYGVSFGFTIVLTTSMFAETSTLCYRGKGLLLLNAGASLGKLLGVLLAFICLQNFHKGNWRMMILLSSVPNTIALFGVFFVLMQSPRFLATQDRFEQCFQILEKMIKKNHPQREESQNQLSIQEKNEILQWHKLNFDTENKHLIQCNIDQSSHFQKKQELGSIFSRYYLRTTVLLCLGWLSINFMYFGQLVALPFIYGNQQKSFGAYAITIAGQIPSFFVSVFLVDRQGYGRKTSLFYFFILSAILHGTFIFLPLTIITSLSRLSMKMCFQMLYPFTTQSFNTLNRTSGFGFCTAMGRISASIMPYIIFPLIQINAKLIFPCFIVSALIGSIATYFVLNQPMNKPLDQKKNQSVEMEMSQ